MIKVIKRNGKKEKFDLDKIKHAVKKAYVAENKEMPSSVLDKILSDVDVLIKNKSVVDVEAIQDRVEQSLMAAGEYEVVRNYITYRDKHKQMRAIEGLIEDRVGYIEDYMKFDENAATSSETDPNANVSIKNVANIDGEVYKVLNRPIQRYRMRKKLGQIYPEVEFQYEKDLESHIIYAHDEASAPTVKNYCEAVTLYPLVQNGTKQMDGLGTTPPHCLSSFCGQLVNITFLLAAQCKGAVAFGELFNFLDYFCTKDFGPDYHKRTSELASSSPRRSIGSAIHQAYQQIVYGWNQPAGNRSYQSPFTNISYYDKNYWFALFEDFMFPDGTKPEWERVDFLQKDFIRWFNKERTKALLTFPVETMALLTDGQDIIDKDYKDFTAEMYSKGHSFFTYISDNPNALASCCFQGNEYIKVRYKDGSACFVTVKDFVENQTSEINSKGVTDLNSTFFIDSYVKDTQVRERTTITGVLKKLFTGTMVKIYSSQDNFIEVTENHPILVQNEEGKVEQISALKFASNPNSYSIFVDNLNFKLTAFQKAFKVETSKVKNKVVYDIQLEKNHFFSANGIITHNCRLRNEIDGNAFSFSTGLTGVQTGSANVITLNLNRIIQDWFNQNYDKTVKEITGENFIQSENVQECFKKYLIDILERVYKYHIAYKQLLYEVEEKGMLNASSAGYISMGKLYSTIGLNGVNEAAEFLGIKCSYNQNYITFCNLITGIISEQNKLHSKPGFKFNTEFVPGESLGARNYNWDKKDGYQVPADRNLYNSYFYLANDPDTSILDKIRMHGHDFTAKLDGGVGCHLNLEDHLSKSQYLKIIDYAIQEGCTYFCINVPNSECTNDNCHFITKHPMDVCPKCGAPMIQYTRVIGYLRPIKNFSKDRLIEAQTRVYSKPTDIKFK